MKQISTTLAAGWKIWFYEKRLTVGWNQMKRQVESTWEPDTNNHTLHRSTRWIVNY
jgi:hypothetical protein